MFCIQRVSILDTVVYFFGPFLPFLKGWTFFTASLPPVGCGSDEEISNPRILEQLTANISIIFESFAFLILFIVIWNLYFFLSQCWICLLCSNLIDNHLKRNLICLGRSSFRFNFFNLSCNHSSRIWILVMNWYIRHCVWCSFLPIWGISCCFKSLLTSAWSIFLNHCPHEVHEWFAHEFYYNISLLHFFFFHSESLQSLLWIK